MEIEKINDNQIKFMITSSDLSERNIEYSELVYNSDKMRKLFEEMMDKALDKFDFRADDTPLMIEVIPASFELIIVIVTKVTDPAEIEDRFSYFSDEDNPVEEAITDEIKSRVDEYIEERLKENVSKPKSVKKIRNGDYVLVYSFDSINTIADASKIIATDFKGKSSVHKLNNRFYLLIENKKGTFLDNKLFEATLSEYGQKHKTTFISKNYLLEHGEKFVKENAVEIFSKYL